MEKIKAVIIEDEAPARDLIKAYLKDYPEIETVAECENGFSGVKAISELHPDLIFLDIQMPKLTGFEMLELLDELPEIIFTTAYDEYAIKAFEMNAVDYLMKPFSRERFGQALQKVYMRLKSKSEENKSVKKLLKDVKNDSKELNKIFVKTGSRIDVIPVDEILHIEAEDDYVEIVTPKGKFLKKETMQFLENNLPRDTFLRVHRSSIVNLNQIDKIEKYAKESYLIILKSGERINVSKSRIKELRKQLGI
jgi:two-component system LytT family response regulator